MFRILPNSPFWSSLGCYIDSGTLIFRFEIALHIKCHGNQRSNGREGIFSSLNDEVARDTHDTKGKVQHHTLGADSGAINVWCIYMYIYNYIYIYVDVHIHWVVPHPQ